MKKKGSNSHLSSRNNPRLAAAKSIIKWMKSGKVYYLSSAKFSNHSDHALYRHLFSNALRHRSRLEFFVRELTQKELGKLDIEVVACLMIGLIQLLDESKVESHAAIFETVELMPKFRKNYLKKYLNAILRRFQREKTELETKLSKQPLNVRTSHPQFLVEKWEERFGKKEAKSICYSNNVIPDLHLVFHPRIDLKSVISVLAKKGFGVNREEGNGLSIKNPAGFFDLDFIKNGECFVQDKTFQSISRLISQVPKSSILDICAAPGGKSLFFDWFYGDEIQSLIATEIDLSRIKRLKENVLNLKSKANIIAMDANAPAFKSQFDLVIADVPCSATGTIKKHPELKWNREKADFLKNQEYQLNLLGNSKNLVKQHGHLLYITCSLEPEENEQVANRFLFQFKDEFQAIRFEKKDAAPGLITKDGFFQCLPDKSQMGGFAALFQRM